MGRAMQPVSVDGIEFDALMSSTEAYDATVPEYSVETGFAVSDTIILSPETLDMTLLVSNRPVTWAKRFGNSGDRVAEVVKRLKSLYFQKKLISVMPQSSQRTPISSARSTEPRDPSIIIWLMATLGESAEYTATGPPLTVQVPRTSKCVKLT